MENINAYKALAFFDLDGTLLNGQSQLDPDVIDAIHEIRRNGVLPFIATGRGHFELDNIMEATGITGAVAMNGQYIVLDGQTIYKDPISIENIEKLLEFFELPIRCDNNVDEVYNQMFYDKKTSSGKIKIVALKKIGEAFIDSSNDVANIKKAIEYIAK